MSKNGHFEIDLTNRKSFLIFSGLAVFISDIRNCKSKEAEVKRINKELANIRNKFKVTNTIRVP